MKVPQHVLYIPGVGGLPEVQDRVAELWLSSGLLVETMAIDWAGSDYRDRLAEIGARAVELSTEGKVHVVGASGGGKAAIELLATTSPKVISRAVTINTKIGEYDPESLGWQELENLVISSRSLPEKLAKLGMVRRSGLLTVRSRTDRMVNPQDTILRGAYSMELPIDGHREGITDVIENRGDLIELFLRVGAVRAPV